MLYQSKFALTRLALSLNDDFLHEQSKSYDREGYQRSSRITLIILSLVCWDRYLIVFTCLQYLFSIVGSPI
jgi:hypothetical protein